MEQVFFSLEFSERQSKNSGAKSGVLGYKTLHGLKGWRVVIYDSATLAQATRNKNAMAES